MIKISPSSISPFKDCPKCGWLAFHENVKRPRGIFPSLPGGMDGHIKTYFDGYRALGKLPPALQGKIDGVLFPDQDRMKAWRNWRSGLQYMDQAGRYQLIGALDDLAVSNLRGDGNIIYTPVDYKTRGYAPKEKADSVKYYGLQLDIYALLLESNGMKTSGKAYLVYFWPKEVKDAGIIEFNIEPMELDTDKKRALDFIDMALGLIALDTPPAPAPDCEYCTYVKQRGEF